MDIELSRYNLIHMTLGGAICLFAMYVLLSIAPIAVRLLLFNIGSLGVLAFNESLNAVYLLMLGIAYLPSGFFGGLYTGYRIKEDLRILLIFPAVIGVVGIVVLRLSTGLVGLSGFNVQNEVLIPLLGNVVGAYLGGYTLNWETEEIIGPSRGIELDMSEVKS